MPVGVLGGAIQSVGVHRGFLVAADRRADLSASDLVEVTPHRSARCSMRSPGLGWLAAK